VYSGRRPGWRGMCGRSNLWEHPTTPQLGRQGLCDRLRVLHRRWLL